ncbi:glycoside hydrolase family 97 protein [Candidatus Omnitrophota bacterium]
MIGYRSAIKSYAGFFLLITCFVLSCSSLRKPVEIVSPDNRIIFRLNPYGGDNGKTLTYTVSFNDVPVIVESELGMKLKGKSPYSEDIRIKGVDMSNYNKIYTMPYGNNDEIANFYNQAIILLSFKNKLSINLVIRVYNDGAAFRYHIPKQKNMTDINIERELTTFNFAGNHQYWGLHLDNYTTSYETENTHATLKNITHETLIGLPLLIKAHDHAWAAITEADLTDYAGMYLRGVSGNPAGFMTDLSPLPGQTELCVKATTPHDSPWRVIMLGKKPGDLIESNIVINLNEHYEGDFSWVKPGRVAWDWWSGQTVKGKGFEGTMDNRTMKYYIDFAGYYGIEYMLVDAEWYGDHVDADVDITKSIPKIDVPELVEYAARNNVGIILWLNWQNTNRQMDEAFALYEKWGVKGVKVDYMNRDDQEMVNFYHRVVKKAAEHKLLVDFHGAYKPTGIRHTYPNLITREGVMGLEYCKWSDRITPDHDCTIPFTRMLAGPMDYTPGGFSNAARTGFKPQMKEPMTQGTRCHQLALFVIYESPLQMLSDHPANYRNQPGMEFLESVPTSWDDTKVITGQVGDYIIMARRIDDEWYMGSITDWDSRRMKVSLDFLGEGNYTAEIYADGSDPEDVKKVERIVTSDDMLDIIMSSGGGHAVRFYPAQ